MAGMMDYTAVRAADDTITFVGVDWSNRKPLRVVTLEFGRKDILVVKHPGGTCWSGVGEPHRYIASKFLVFKILKYNEAKRTYQLDLLADIPTKAK